MTSCCRLSLAALGVASGSGRSWERNWEGNSITETFNLLLCHHRPPHTHTDRPQSTNTNRTTTQRLLNSNRTLKLWRRRGKRAKEIQNRTFIEASRSSCDRHLIPKHNDRMLFQKNCFHVFFFSYVFSFPNALAFMLFKKYQH